MLPSLLSSERKLIDWLRALASQVKIGWGPGTGPLSPAGKEQTATGPPPSFLSLQKNVTLQCVFWVEDLTCECGGGSELGRYLEAGSGGPRGWGRWS